MSTASVSGSVFAYGACPRLRLTALAPASAAHVMPLMTASSGQKPSSVQTLPISSSASGATPLYLPAEAAPVPAMVEAVWVPCPLPSTTEPVPVKSLVSPVEAVSDRSGWVGS